MKKILISILIIFCLLTAGVYFYLILDQPEIENNDSKVENNLKDKKFLSLAEWIKQQQKTAQEKMELLLEQEKQKPITLLAVGDIMLSRNVGSKMVKYQDYHHPFLKVKDIISQADIAFGNLESPIIAGAPVLTGSFSFRADPETAEGLSWAGFDVLGLTNNHILNQNEKGLLKTFEYLENNKIKYCGAAKNNFDLDNNFAVMEVKGRKIAFLCYAYGPDNYEATAEFAGMALMQETQLKNDLIKVKEMADFVIVSMHDGIEYQHKSSLHQQTFAHLAIDNGADLVIGHHPHVVQEIEKYKDKYIAYSLGNFVFDQMWSLDTQQGIAVEFTIQGDEIKPTNYFPVMIEDYSQPRLAEGKEAEAILKYLGVE